MNFKHIFKQTISEGEIVPKHMGVAYHHWFTDHATCYIVPVHLFVRFGRIFWMKIRIPTWNRLERAYISEIRQMKREAFEEGLQRGFVDGYLTKSMENPIPAKYAKGVSNAIIRLQQQFRRGLRREDIPLP